MKERFLKVLIESDLNTLKSKLKVMDFSKSKGTSSLPMGIDTFVCGIAEICFEPQGKDALVTCKEHTEQGEEADLTAILEFPFEGYIEFTNEVIQTAKGVTELWPRNIPFLADEWKLDDKNDVNRFYYKGQLTGWIRAKQYEYTFKTKGLLS